MAITQDQPVGASVYIHSLAHLLSPWGGIQGLLSGRKLSCMTLTWWPGDGVGGWQQLPQIDPYVFPLVAVWALDRH